MYAPMVRFPFLIGTMVSGPEMTWPLVMVPAGSRMSDAA
jgi:hypothetical protein